MAWYPAKSVTVTAEPVTLTEVKQHCRVDFDDDDAVLIGTITAARAHAERYCNARFATQSVERECEDWADLQRLADGPVSAVESISYVDPQGEVQFLDDAVYRVNSDGYEPSVTLMDGHAWPAVMTGSKITVSGTYGGDCPSDVRLAIIAFVDAHYNKREDAARGLPAIVDVLLSNHRRGA